MTESAKNKIMRLCENDPDMAERGAMAEMAVSYHHPELEPGREEFYAEVLREMGQ